MRHYKDKIKFIQNQASITHISIFKYMFKRVTKET